LPNKLAEEFAVIRESNLYDGNFLFSQSLRQHFNLGALPRPVDSLDYNEFSARRHSISASLSHAVAQLLLAVRRRAAAAAMADG
jgi:hypothetical protein